MCKPKDDLRKDCRLMEFNCLINKVTIIHVKNKTRHYEAEYKQIGSFIIQQKCACKFKQFQFKQLILLSVIIQRVLYLTHILVLRL